MQDFYLYQRECANTKFILKSQKKSEWQKFCSNLNTSTPLTVFWESAKKFKGIIQPAKHPLNDDWFSGFCSKIAPDYVPLEEEYSPQILLPPTYYILLLQFFWIFKVPMTLCIFRL